MKGGNNGICGLDRPRCSCFGSAFCAVFCAESLKNARIGTDTGDRRDHSQGSECFFETAIPGGCRLFCVYFCVVGHPCADRVCRPVYAVRVFNGGIFLGAFRIFGHEDRHRRQRAHRDRRAGQPEQGTARRFFCRKRDGTDRGRTGALRSFDLVLCAQGILFGFGYDAHRVRLYCDQHDHLRHGRILDGFVCPRRRRDLHEGRRRRGGSGREGGKEHSRGRLPQPRRDRRQRGRQRGRRGGNGRRSV